MFLEQNYVNRELIILDDGVYPIRSLVPKNDRIRYFRLPRMNIGDKRNTLCTMAHGEIIVHWDDDDFSAPWRIEMQVKALKEHNADVTGLNNVYFLDKTSGDGWLYTWPEGRGPWVHGATLAYYKEHWKTILFPSVPNAEDLLFVFSTMAGPKAPYVTHYNRWFVGLLHENNTSGKSTGRYNWSRAKLPTWIQNYFGMETKNEKGA